MITLEEIENLENAINAAIKQTSFLIMSVIMAPDTQQIFDIKTLLGTNIVFAQALETIEKLKNEKIC